MEEVSEYKEAVVNYICGYVVRYNCKQDQGFVAGNDRYMEISAIRNQAIGH